MAAEILTIGDKMDLHHIYSAMGGLLAEKTYTSQLLDFDGIRHAKILMPIVGNRVVPLELQDEYELLFYTEKGMYLVLTPGLWTGMWRKIFLCWK